MCLAIPMRLSEIEAGGKAFAEVDGIRHGVDVSLLDSPKVGEYVIVHAGFAIERLDEARAKEILDLFAELANAAGEGP